MSNQTTAKKPDIKPLEVGVGAGAAVITAFASSFLGTAGTLSGAALASVVGTVSTSLLRSSAARSAERLRETTARLRETRTGSPQPTDVRPVESDSNTVDPYGTQLSRAPDPERAQRKPGRKPLLMLGAATVAAFAAALVLITGIESAAGKPLAALVGHETGGGTTIGRATGTDTGTSRPAPTGPTPTPTDRGAGGPTPSATEDPSTAPTTQPSATEPTPAPPTTADPTVSAPVPSVAPSATTSP